MPLPVPLGQAGESFYEIGVDVAACSPRIARVIAFFATTLGILDDPYNVQVALKACHDLISPVQRERWLRAWCATQGLSTIGLTLD